MENKWKKFKLLQRTLSAIILLPVILYAVYDGYYIYFATISLISILSLLEWVQMVNVKALKITEEISKAKSDNLLNKTLDKIPHKTLEKKVIMFNLDLYTLGFVYISLFAWAMIDIRNQEHGAFITFWILITVFATDIGGYFCGIIIGGPKLAKKISPNKTWSGFLGGIIFASIVGISIQNILQNISKEYINVHLSYDILLMSIIISIIAQIGDLIESYFKRYFGVKDSGNIIPGHGGVLDRIDGIISSSIFFAVFLYFFK